MLHDIMFPLTLHVDQTVAFAQPRTAAAEVIRQFDEGKSNKHIKSYQTIFHPGEVSRLSRHNATVHIAGSVSHSSRTMA